MHSKYSMRGHTHTNVAKQPRAGPSPTDTLTGPRLRPSCKRLNCKGFTESTKRLLAVTLMAPFLPVEIGRSTSRQRQRQPPDHCLGFVTDLRMSSIPVGYVRLPTRAHRQLGGPLSQHRFVHDRVPPVDRLRTVPDHRPGGGARDASTLQVPDGGPPEVMRDATRDPRR